MPRLMNLLVVSNRTILLVLRSNYMHMQAIRTEKHGIAWVASLESVSILRRENTMKTQNDIPRSRKVHVVCKLCAASQTGVMVF